MSLNYNAVIKYIASYDTESDELHVYEDFMALLIVS